ncbi:MAG: Uma2 family endonuclease [Nitrospinae bacterium]|nr:Uma2 family endonuclease [Nitrospinota bacterium]
MGVLTDEKKRFSYQDYLKTPEDKRYELIEGELVMTPSPVPYHQWVAMNIAFEIREFVKRNDMGKVFLSPCDVYLDDENVLQPDILFISNERINIIGEKNIQGAPDLVIEILSENTAYTDMVKKKRLYARFGVKEYWIVATGEKTVEVYSLKGGAFVLERSYSKDFILESPLLVGLKIGLSVVFEF